MKHLFKKGIALLVALVVMLSVFTFSVSAAGSSVAFSKSNLKVGETLTVTARFSTSSNDPMYGLEGYITYDPSVIEFVSGDNCNLLTNGKVKVVLQSAGKTNLTETVKFKTLKAGKSSIALEQFVYVNKDDAEKTLSGSSAVVTVSNPSAAASSNANLKSLIVSAGTLTPKFDPNVTEYNITIKNDITELWVSTTKADAKASVTVEGSKDMKVGLNKRVVVVTAENGTTKRYTLNITRLDVANQQPVTPPPTEGDEPLNDLIEVNVGEDTMYVVEDFADAELPKGFEITEYALNGKTVPALTADNYIVLMLRLPDNSQKAFYVYDDEGVFSELIGVSIGGQIYYILPTKNVPEGYSAVNDFTIGDVVVPAFRNDSAGYEDFAVVYAKGPTGITSYYSYDTVENTIQRISNITVNVVKNPGDSTSKSEEEEQKDLISTLTQNFVSLNTNGKIVVITILAIIFLLLVAIIVLIVKIATSGRRDDDFEEDEEDDFEIKDDDIVGFEYISVAENAKPSEEVNIPVTPEEASPVQEEAAPAEAEETVAEETAEEKETAEAEETAEEEEKTEE